MPLLSAPVPRKDLGPLSRASIDEQAAARAGYLAHVAGERRVVPPEHAVTDRERARWLQGWDAREYAARRSRLSDRPRGTSRHED